MDNLPYMLWYIKGGAKNSSINSIISCRVKHFLATLKCPPWDIRHPMINSLEFFAIFKPIGLSKWSFCVFVGLSHSGLRSLPRHLPVHIILYEQLPLSVFFTNNTSYWFMYCSVNDFCRNHAESSSQFGTVLPFLWRVCPMSSSVSRFSTADDGGVLRKLNLKGAPHVWPRCFKVTCMTIRPLDHGPSKSGRLRM